jgi:membrane fusion protein
MPAADDALPYLEHEPPHWVARGLARLILALAVILLLAAVLVHLPETVSGRFVLVPATGTDPVRTLRDGVVADIRVRESDSVARGQPLFLVRSAALVDRGAERRSLESQRRSIEQRLPMLDAEYQLRRRADSAELARLEARGAHLQRLVESRTRRLALLRELADSASAGIAGGAVPLFEARRLELEVRSLAEDVENGGNDLAENRADRARVEREARLRALDHEQQRRILVENAETQGIRIASLAPDLADVTDSGVVMLAPCAGTVLRLRVKTKGTVVGEGVVLAELACQGQPLLAELEVPQAGMPLVQAGQGVKLRFDAFPYQRYGVRFGQVRWVGPSGLQVSDSGAFRALVSIADSAVRVRGRMRPLLAGMGGYADIVTGRRSLLSFAFEPLRALRESFVDAPAQP